MAQDAAFQKRLLLQVVADAGDGAINVDVGQGQTRRRAHSGRASSDFGQFLQVAF